MDQNYTRLLVVRHPFQRYLWNFWCCLCMFTPHIRLVSAFRDKLERCHSFQGNVCDLTKDWYFNKYGKSIVKRFRKNYLTKFGPASLSDRCCHLKCESNINAVYLIQQQQRSSLPRKAYPPHAHLVGVCPVGHQFPQSS